VREAARLQSFPDTFIFRGGIEAQQQQVANAVPPLLVQALASTILHKMIRRPVAATQMAVLAPDLAPARLPRGRANEKLAELKTYFRSLLGRWARDNLRDLPWRKTKEPYRIFIAEVLLRKTSAAQVEPVYTELVDKYPTVEALAQASLADLRAVISPIGLPDRADWLKKAAQQLLRDYYGLIPPDRRELAALPGVGPYIAAAVMCFAYDKPVPIADSNIIRIFTRFFGLVSEATRPRNDPAVWSFAAAMVPQDWPSTFNKALVDFGALVCTHHSPKCETCPVRRRCAANRAKGG
jgi:A/G-specific adenine glycosylase